MNLWDFLDPPYIIRCRTTTSDGVILNNNNMNNSIMIKVSPSSRPSHSGDKLKYCGSDAEMIDMLSKFSKFSLKITSTQEINDTEINLRTRGLFYATEKVTNNNIISPTLSYFHIITFLSGKIRKSNKAESFKFIQSYTNDVWTLIIVSIILLALTSCLLNSKKSSLINFIYYYFRLIINQTTKLKRSLMTASWILAAFLFIQHFNSKFLSNIVYVPMNSVKTLDDVIHQAEMENVRIIEFFIQDWKCSKLMGKDRVNRICKYLERYDRTKTKEYILASNAGIY